MTTEFKEEWLCDGKYLEKDVLNTLKNVEIWDILEESENELKEEHDLSPEACNTKDAFYRTKLIEKLAQKKEFEKELEVEDCLWDAVRDITISKIDEYIEELKSME